MEERPDEKHKIGPTYFRIYAKCLKCGMSCSATNCDQFALEEQQSHEKNNSNNSSPQRARSVSPIRSGSGSNNNSRPSVISTRARSDATGHSSITNSSNNNVVRSYPQSTIPPAMRQRQRSDTSSTSSTPQRRSAASNVSCWLSGCCTDSLLSCIVCYFCHSEGNVKGLPSGLFRAKYVTSFSRTLENCIPPLRSMCLKAT